MSRKKPVKRAKKQAARRLKRSIFAYPLFIFLLLCAGVFLVAWTLKANADIFVTAKVSAATVTDPAVITSPDDGAHVSSVPVTVEGTCPANASYIEIFNGSQMAGSALCDSGGGFSLSVNLLPGQNSLTAHAFNKTDDQGPVSSPVSVYYDVPAQPQQNLPGGGGTAQNPKSQSAPFNIQTSFLYRGFKVGDLVSWPISINGGTVPYAVNVEWGDGTADLFTRTTAGQFDLEHTYTQPGGYQNSYTIKVKATDSAGKTAYIQFFVIIVPQNVHQAGILNKTLPKIGGGLSWLWLAWPLYIVIMLMVISYRLGEREELIIIRKKGLLRR
jgi:hypothetical protein